MVNFPSDPVFKVTTPTGQSVHDYWRYEFARSAMEILLSKFASFNDRPDDYVEKAIEYADALLAKLEEKIT